MSRRPVSNIPAPLVALSGWLLPGLGYLLIGERKRGLIAGITIIATFLAGILIGGVRVIDVPGFDNNGQMKTVVMPDGDRAATLRVAPLQEVMNKPWYIAQLLMGPTNLIATWGSLAAATAGHKQSTARIFDIGTLYTAVAGMLNLLALIDAAHRTTHPGEIEDDDAEMIEKRNQQNEGALADAAAVTAGVNGSREPSTGGPA